MGHKSVNFNLIDNLLCLLQRVTERKIQGGIEVTGRQGRRCRKLLDNLKEIEDTVI
jgi:hypothetical protein